MCLDWLRSVNRGVRSRLAVRGSQTSSCFITLARLLASPIPDRLVTWAQGDLPKKGQGSDESERRLSRRVPAAILLFLGAFAVAGCEKQESAPSANGSRHTPQAAAVAPAPTPAPLLPEGQVRLTFTYGSEKRAWINDVTKAFNDSAHKTAGGKSVFVEAVAQGSGECIDDILSGRRQADLTSPASMAFVKLGNADSRAKTGQDLLGPTENLVLSPVVIAMWKPMAEALGWGAKPVGWAEILALAKNPTGWAAYGHPEWGRFKFGHTHPGLQQQRVDLDVRRSSMPPPARRPGSRLTMCRTRTPGSSSGKSSRPSRTTAARPASSPTR